MNFLYKEKQKISLWWKGISKKEIIVFTFSAITLLTLIFMYYRQIHISGLSSWHRFLRCIVESFFLLFLTQLMTGKSILHPFWRIGYFPFALWITIFPYCLTHAINNTTPTDFNHLSPYFLTGMGIFLLLFFVMNIISKAVLGKKMMSYITLGLVAYFSAIPMIYFLYTLLTGLVMTPHELYIATNMPTTWLSVIIYPKVGFVGSILLFLSFILYLIIYHRWIWSSAYHLNPRWKNQRGSQISIIYRIVQILVFAGCVWLVIRWSSECFPMKDFESLEEYENYLEMIKTTLP